VFDLEFAPLVHPAGVTGRAPDMWRYREALPLALGGRVSLGEAMTPLVPLHLAGREVLVKAEQGFPTGSYKDRGAAVMIARARETGVAEVVEDSSGNAGAAVAAYCARAGIACRIFVPADTSPSKLAQIELYGAQLVKVPGSREDTAAAVLEAAQEAFYASHCYNPWFFHGVKTWAYELAEQLGWEAPDAVVLPAGNGTLLLGAHLGFRDLAGAGIIPAAPKLVAVQTAGCAPLHRAFEQGLDEPAAVESTSTLAEGIAIARPVRGAQMLEAVRESGGSFLAVDDGETAEALLDMGRRGFCIEPTSAAVIAGLKRYAAAAPVGERIVSVFTGHGLKAAGTIHTMLAAGG
jgi:threonine synthase